jgi:hypothetical protein
MELKYKEPPVSEGGAALPGCGTIHRSEVHSTLTKLSDDLEFPFDLNEYTLGSTGKKDYSGDIDLVLDDKWYGHGPGQLRSELEELFGKDNVARNGNMIHLRYSIVGYKTEYNARKPRTGLVQVDFNLGDSKWERIYHYSPGEESEYKGAHRNLAIAAITTVAGVISSRILDGYDRPAEQVRWKFGPNGFIKVQRTSAKDRSGIWKRKQDDVVLQPPIKDANEIAQQLFPHDGCESDLHSLETIVDAVKRNFGMVDQERIWRRCAENFYDWKDGRNFVYPPEIEKYYPPNDK